MAVVELDIQYPIRLPTLEAPNPMNCRGMELLGFPGSGTVYFCVHQCSVELWRLYDTPRVSIQKKIADLHIQLTNCNKEQIRQLREAGIIENFRATMIALRDTERLFDALEFSRKKRGLLKHALKAKSDPSERILRVEERRARRLKARSLVCEEPKIIPVDSGPALPIPAAYARANFIDEECALNEDTEVPVFEDLYCEDRLLVAEDAVATRDLRCKHSIEVVSNDVQIVGELDVQSNCVPIHRMEHCIISTSGSADHNYVNSLESPRSSEIAFPSVLTPKSVANRSRLSSPTFDSSEVEEIRSTCSTYSNSLRSLSGSPKRLSATPDRFLFLDSDSEGESEQTQLAVSPLDALTSTTLQSDNGNCSFQSTDLCVHNSFTVTEGQASPSARGPPTLNHKKPILLKLRHLAQATSPSSQATLKQLVNLQSRKSLVVSVPLSLLKSCMGTADSGRNGFQKGKREVALSSFVTKKRASSRTLSSSSENSASSDPPYRLGAGTMSRRGRGRGRGRAKQLGYTRKQSLKSRYKPGPRGRNRSKSDQREPFTLPELSDGRSGPRPSRRWSALGREEHLPMDLGLPWEVLETRQCQREKAAVEDEIAGPIANCVSASCNSNENNRTHAFTGNFAAQYGGSEPPINGTSATCLHQDDDQLSVTSSSTNSTTSSFRGGTSSRRSALNLNTGKNGLDATSSFCFEDLFSFCPPKLIVKDGDLVPEKSLQVKDLDRHSIPKGHPLLKWTLGQPIKGAAVGKKISSRRKRGCKH